MAKSKAAWAIAARPVLERVAQRYHANIRYAELTEDVQQATGIKTRMLMHYWIGDVLGSVSYGCRAKDEPLLSALCVDSTGSVDPGFGGLIAELEGSEPDDLDEHAAEERLKSYRHFGAKLPPDGGRQALTPQLATRRQRERRISQDTRPTAVSHVLHGAAI